MDSLSGPLAQAGCGHRRPNEVLLSHTRSVHGSARDRLVEVHVAITDLDVESAIGIAAHPGLVVNRRSLTSKVGQRQQAATDALSA